jgi:hypothetical protein
MTSRPVEQGPSVGCHVAAPRYFLPCFSRSLQYRHRRIPAGWTRSWARTSSHYVADLAEALDRVHAALVSGWRAGGRGMRVGPIR